MNEDVKQPEKPKRSLNVALPEAVEAKLREMAALTNLPVYVLAEHVADSPDFTRACLKVLRARYVEWWNAHNDADTIFGPEEADELAMALFRLIETLGE